MPKLKLIYSTRKQSIKTQTVRYIDELESSACQQRILELRGPTVRNVLVVGVLVSHADDPAQTDEKGDVLVAGHGTPDVKTQCLMHMLHTGGHFNPAAVVVAFDAKAPRLTDAPAARRRLVAIELVATAGNDLEELVLRWHHHLLRWIGHGPHRAWLCFWCRRNALR
eukprot:m.281884 g.281884  ORF g.281884 m.281884 type:complete len:167 (+) comp16181_c0_seq1:1270-1770(+)